MPSSLLIIHKNMICGGGIQAQLEMEALKAEKERTKEEKQKIGATLLQQHKELQSHYQVTITHTF